METLASKLDKDTPGQGVPTLIYGLQALSFLVGLTWIAAIIVIYLKQDEVRSSWLYSHYRWARRTFWFSLLWAVIGASLLIFVVGAIILMVNAVWVIYRIARGWLNLHAGKPMYA